MGTAKITFERGKLWTMTVAMVAIVTATTSTFVYFKATQRQDYEIDMKFERLYEEIQIVKHDQRILERNLSALESEREVAGLNAESTKILTKDLEDLLTRLKELYPPSDGKETSP